MQIKPTAAKCSKAAGDKLTRSHFPG
jgi:hypothetical protein